MLARISVLFNDQVHRLTSEKARDVNESSRELLIRYAVYNSLCLCFLDLSPGMNMIILTFLKNNPKTFTRFYIVKLRIS